MSLFSRARFGKIAAQLFEIARLKPAFDNPLGYDGRRFGIIELLVRQLKRLLCGNQREADDAKKCRLEPQFNQPSGSLQASLGLRAAAVSSRRRRGAKYGACFRLSSPSSARCVTWRNAVMN